MWEGVLGSYTFGAQESLPAVLGSTWVPGKEPGLAACRASALPAVFLWPLIFFFFLSFFYFLKESTFNMLQDYS